MLNSRFRSFSMEIHELYQAVLQYTYKWWKVRFGHFRLFSPHHFIYSNPTYKKHSKYQFWFKFVSHQKIRFEVKKKNWLLVVVDHDKNYLLSNSQPRPNLGVDFTFTWQQQQEPSPKYVRVRIPCAMSKIANEECKSGY